MVACPDLYRTGFHYGLKAFTLHPGSAAEHATYKPLAHLQVFAAIRNLFDRKYATWGILSDPTGIGAPGTPANAVTSGPGVDNRFLSPAAPLEVFAGVRITF